MRQVEEEYWKFTDTSGVGNATNQKHTLVSPTPVVQQGQINSLPEDQKNGIERWVGEMNSNMLGLQPRANNISIKVDGRRRTSGVSESSSKTTLSVPGIVSKNSTSQGAMVPVSQGPKETIPKNEIEIVCDQSDDWEGT